MIYIPGEDSYLLESQVRKYARKKKVLDLGTGSGILALTAIKFKALSVLASDINEESINYAKSLGIEAIKSNLFLHIKSKFDLIIFNPPYLPQDEREDKESQQVTTGGKKGDEIILKFLKQARNHLNPKGIILLLVSSLTPMKRINNILEKQKLKSKIIAEKKLFMESLYVLEIKE